MIKIHILLIGYIHIILTNNCMNIISDFKITVNPFHIFWDDPNFHNNCVSLNGFLGNFETKVFIGWYGFNFILFQKIYYNIIIIDLI